MLIYLLKANIALVLFYLAYHFGLRRLTFYTLNRFFLLGGIICAAVCPFIDPSLFIQQHQPLNAVAETYIPDLTAFQTRQSVPFMNVLVEYVFWAGVVVMSIRLMIQLFSLWRLHRHTRATFSPDDQQLRIMEKQVNPFSFMRNIYINPSLHSPEEFTSIIRHEQVHVRQWHTLDVLMGELNKIFYWFNPGAWLMSIAIRENLEFITDRSILRQGMDAKAYQYSLIKVSGIPYATAIANNFNFSHLKQRIMMMNKKKSSRYHLLRYVVLGAIMGIAVLSLNFTRAIAKTETSVKYVASIVLPKDTVKPAAPWSVPPPPPPAPPAPPAPVKGKAVPAVPPAPAAPTATAVPAAPAAPAPVATPGATSMQMDAKSISLGKPSNGHEPLIFLDGVNLGHTMPEGLMPESIQSINVLKGEHAAVYGEDGKNGVILINTKGYMGTKATKDGSAVQKQPTVVQYVGKANTGTGTPVPAANEDAKTISDVKIVGYVGSDGTVSNANTNASGKTNTNVNTDAAKKKTENK
ncbi:M56 family metallopeptidase [Chitinophaga sp. S165]|uniref:M56 family metallopeptidase n=1 Tax=Chitinophaga sp. S165 TaxID=2135462 RepID=UPI000D711BEE|nr:M56 family metallopeptidase [Chitinophaga sp. S165]PWV50673.1 TonB-dependent SusC/RagA subfamily outer membrane receptor [Chitinophaga sp. S165]